MDTEDTTYLWTILSNIYFDASKKRLSVTFLLSSHRIYDLLENTKIKHSFGLYIT